MDRGDLALALHLPEDLGSWMMNHCQSILASFSHKSVSLN